MEPGVLVELIYSSGNIRIVKLVVGPLATNTYIVYDTREMEGAIIDPGGDADKILDALKKIHANIKYIIATHAHFDHVLAVPILLDYFDANFIMHNEDLEILEYSTYLCRSYVPDWSPPDVDDENFVDEGDEIVFGDISLKVIHTPGHTPGSISLYGGEYVFTGDTLFRNAIGRTDFPGGNWEQMVESIIRLMALPDETIVFPGHGRATSIGRERKENPYVKQIMSYKI